MLLGLIDFPGASGSARSLTFSQPESLAALDVVIWLPDAIAGLYGSALGPQGMAPLGLLQSQDLVMHTRAWREEFRDFLARGGSLVVLGPSFEALPLHTPQDIVGYDPLEALPEKFRVQRAPVDPCAVECRYGEPFRSLFASISDLLLARSTLSQVDSQAIAGTGDQICGLYRFVHPGRLMVLPSLAAMLDRASAQRLIEAISATISGLRRSAAQVGSAARHLLPRTSEETRLARELESVTAQRRQLEQTEFELRARLGWLSELASLLIEDAGEPLAVAAAALQSLGGRILHEFDQADGVIVEAQGHTLLLTLANPNESARDCRQRLGPMVHARREETGRPLQLMVVKPGESAAGFDGLADESAPADGLRWRFLSGRDLYEACTGVKTGSLSALMNG